MGSKEAKAVVLREARAKLQEEIVKHKEEQAAKVERLAKELGLDRKEVEKLRAATGLKSKRGHSLWDAKVWQKRREMNDGG
jgi:HD-GYP domain-containing protein (c-di-GMP phosphodiesterase class II)